MPEHLRPSAADDLEARFEQIERILHDLIGLHRKLETCIERKKEAIRSAAIDDVEQICEEENVIVQQISDLEKARLALVGVVTEALSPDAAEPLTIGQIADAADGECGARMMVLRDELRDLVKQVRRSSSVVRIAADKLNRHMIGILQTVRSALSGAGVYERKGQVALGAQLEFSVDVRS